MATEVPTSRPRISGCGTVCPLQGYLANNNSLFLTSWVKIDDG